MTLEEYSVMRSHIMVCASPYDTVLLSPACKVNGRGKTISASNFTGRNSVFDLKRLSPEVPTCGNH